MGAEAQDARIVRSDEDRRVERRGAGEPARARGERGPRSALCASHERLASGDRERASGAVRREAGDLPLRNLARNAVIANGDEATIPSCDEHGLRHGRKRYRELSEAPSSLDYDSRLAPDPE